MLIPSAGNSAHKSVLQTGLKIVKGHRQHAKEAAIVLK
jgi:predicted outer membrane protein